MKFRHLECFHCIYEGKKKTKPTSHIFFLSFSYNNNNTHNKNTYQSVAATQRQYPRNLHVFLWETLIIELNQSNSYK